MQLPNPDQAIIEPAKIRDYLLSLSHPVGPSGMQAQVETVWIVLVGEDIPRLVTVYPGADT